MNVAYKTSYAASAAAPVAMFAPIAKAKPLLTSYHVTGDHSTSLVKVWSATAIKTTVDVLSTTGGSNKIISVASTTGFSTDQILVVRPNGTMEWHLVATVQAGVSLTATANIAADIPVNSVVYQMELIATFPLGVTTTSNYGSENGIVGAGLHKPLVLTLNGTSANIIHAASVVYSNDK